MRINLLLAALLFTINLKSQDTLKQYHINSNSHEISIDGELNDEEWSAIEALSDFWIQSPIDDKKAQDKTEVKLCYDDNNIYVAATMYGSDARVIQTLKRDNFSGSDAFGFLIDPVGQKVNGFGFGVNVANAQTEVLIRAGYDDDSGWDVKWTSATKNYEDKWTLEMQIPLKSLRFNDKNSEWRMNFVRLLPSKNETHTWTQVPRQFDVTDLGYFGKLQWNEAPGNSGRNISFLPYSTLQYVRQDDKVKANAGIEMKMAITPSLNVDLTLNPDFSQVDVDEQVTNLTRFNIFFPERRQFFLENNDIFSGFGLNEESLFYSRRIGLDQNGSTIPILYGARISGNISEKTRIGAFNILTDKNEIVSRNNYSAFALQQRVLSRSAIKFIFLNRQGIGKEVKKNDFGRNLGLDLNYTSNDGKWSTYGGLLQSNKFGINNKNFQSYGGISYSGQNFRAFVEAQKVGQNFYTDMGFNNRLENYDPINDEVVRIGYTNVGSMINYYHYPKSSKSVNSHWSGVENFLWFNEGTGFNEWYNRVRHFIFFKNRTELKFRFNNHITDILYPFDIGGYTIQKDKYIMHEFNTQFISDNNKNFVVDAFAVYGDYFGGKKITLRGGIKYRFQPWVNVRVGINQNNIVFPKQQKVNLTLINSRVEVNFSNKLFWTTFIQYNTQQENFGVNSRIQFRYKPMSDLFLVFNDNYNLMDEVINTNRAITLKINYWLGI